MSWRPLLEGALKDHACECVRAIADDPAVFKHDAASDPSLAGGSAGTAILYGYLSQTYRLDRYAHVARGCLNSAISGMEENPCVASLYGGLAGVGWATAHLEGCIAGMAGEETLAEIDEVLLQHLEQSPWKDDYDLINGLVGFGVYALQRLPQPAAAACLTRVIAHLAETAEHRPEGTTWWTDPKWLPAQAREKSPRGYYNLGLAHGAPGVIALLGCVCAADIAVDRARPLLDGAVRWLLAHQNPGGFADAIDADTVDKPARLAWCYGDPGIAAALFSAPRSVDEPAWEREARAIARRAAERPPDQSGVKDAGLCHGAAGLGHLFNRMYQATRDGRLAEAARYWFERTLAMHRPGHGIGGFEAWTADADGTPTWVADSGLLTGSAGIALALLAATTAIEPAWDQMLLVDIPPDQAPRPHEAD